MPLWWSDHGRTNLIVKPLVVCDNFVWMHSYFGHSSFTKKKISNRASLLLIQKVVRDKTQRGKGKKETGKINVYVPFH